MPRAHRLPSLLLLACLLVACDRVPGTQPDPPLPQLGQGDGRAEWRGMLPCVDCSGIETVLVLERRDDARRYDLVETFLAEHGGARFTESGQWRLEGAILSLDGEGGALRNYVLLSDGRLQPSDARGRAFRLRGGDFLVPADAYAP